MAQVSIDFRVYGKLVYFLDLILNKFSTSYYSRIIIEKFSKKQYQPPPLPLPIYNFLFIEKNSNLPSKNFWKHPCSNPSHLPFRGFIRIYCGPMSRRFSKIPLKNKYYQNLTSTLYPRDYISQLK